MLNGTKTFLRPLKLLLVIMAACANGWSAPEHSARLTFKEKDRVVFIGNTFAERLTWHGYFEAMLLSRFPALKLTFRNLAFSGDEALRGTLGTGAGPGGIGPLDQNVFLQLRALNFRDVFSHIEEQQADVILACYGMNEAFHGPAAFGKFETDLRAFLTRLVDLKCGTGKTSPRVVVVSPIPHEDLGGDLPNPAAHNENLKACTEIMRKVTGNLSMPFIDLFNPVQALLEEKSATPLTFNGIHLTRYGNWVVSQIMLEQLGFAEPAAVFQRTGNDHPDTWSLDRLPIPPPPPGVKVHSAVLNRVPVVKVTALLGGSYKLRIDGRDVVEATAAEWNQGVRVQPLVEAANTLLTAVEEKNWEFYMKYRAVNGEYIYGRRKSPFGIVNFPKEFEFQEKLVAEKDGKVHQLAGAPAKLRVELVKADK